MIHGRIFRMTIGERIKAKRKEKNISVEYVAKALGVSVSTVYRYEDSTIEKIPIKVFDKLCQIFETSASELMGNDSTVQKTADSELPREFENAQDAMEFMLKMPTLAAFGGYNPDEMSEETIVEFANEILHYTWRTGQASVSGQVKPAASPFPAFDTLHVEYHNTLNENCYAVESPDGIEPFGKGSYTIQRYGENNIGAGIFYRGQRYNTCILGYPFETIKTEKQRNELMNAILSSFDQTITHQ